MDKVRRRADRCAAGGVNACLIFGFHLRWDFLPVFDRVHEMLRFIADELHQRGIMLIDHHSSCVVHRVRNREEALNIARRNRHHVPFYPSMEEAAKWQVNGSYLNDWRMIDVVTGGPVYLPAYNAQQFCMNNPAFREAYSHYVKRLVAETGVDGLMSDDGIFYADWRACACKHCTGRFEKEYGRRLPAVDDTTFWGNRNNEAFKDWIALRYRSSGDFLKVVKDALPAAFPLLSCCSSSEGWAMPAYGMSYQDFIGSCNIVLLEMAGSTPAMSGRWDNRIPSQMLHLGIAQDHKVPCLGLGYGFFPDTGFFVWAVNKFLGADSWFSTLKGRLNAPQAQLDALPDDSEIMAEGYRWEKAHPHLFQGEVDTDVAVLFSRSTRDYYGQCLEDYVADYYASCLELLHAGVSYEVVTAIPAAGGKIKRLLLSSVTCLSKAERDQLRQFLLAGGIVIATGPTGHYDERARPMKPWLEEFGAKVDLTEPERRGTYPPDSNLGKNPEVARCRLKETPEVGGWFGAPVGRGRVHWLPHRISNKNVAAQCIDMARGGSVPVLKGLPDTWRVRQYRDGKRLLIHAIPGQVEPVFHATLQNQFTQERVIEKIRFTELTAPLTLNAAGLQSATLYSPDLAEPRVAKQATIDPTGVRRYLVVECMLSVG